MTLGYDINKAFRIVKLNGGMNCMTDDAEKFLNGYREILDHTQDQVDGFLASLDDDLPIEDVLRQSVPFMNKLAEDQKNHPKEFDLYIPCHAMIYLLCRRAKPGKVVETGIEKGGSTYMSLCAMDKNDHGHLYSVDIRKWFAYKNQNVSRIGPLITESPISKKLESRWTSIRGNAQKILPSVLKKYGTPDIFMALQGHTYDVQKNEAGASWHLLKNGGIFVLDRPDWNDSRFLREFLRDQKEDISHHETFKEGSADDPFGFTVVIKKSQP